MPAPVEEVITFGNETHQSLCDSFVGRGREAVRGHAFNCSSLGNCPGSDPESLLGDRPFCKDAESAVWQSVFESVREALRASSLGNERAASRLEAELAHWCRHDEPELDRYGRDWEMLLSDSATTLFVETPSTSPIGSKAPSI